MLEKCIASMARKIIILNSTPNPSPTNLCVRGFSSICPKVVFDVDELKILSPDEKIRH